MKRGLLASPLHELPGAGSDGYRARMASSKQKLADLAELFERTGSDPDRLAAVRQTQTFRRSWVDLAKCLHKLRQGKKYSEWGFADFYAYCSKELTLKRATVDKLLISYSTLNRYAPKVLERDGVLKPLPSLESVNYMSKATKAAEQDDAAAANQGPDHLPDHLRDKAPALQALSKAVFEEQRPLRDIKREFNDLLFPKPKEPSPKKRAQRSLNSLRRVKDELLDLDMLSPKLRATLDKTLTLAQEELQDWLESELPSQGKAKERSEPEIVVG